MQSLKSAEAGPGQARVGRGRIMTALVWFLIVYTGPTGWGGNFGPAKLGRSRRGRLCGGVPGGDEKRTRNCAMNCVMRTRLIGHLCVLSLQDDWGPICGGSSRRYRQRVSQIPSTQPRRNCLRERTGVVPLAVELG